jgi:hypothetical protein
MAQAKRKPARKKRKYTLVRGANGALYLISEEKKPVEVDEKQTEKVTKMLDDFEDQLSEIFGIHISGPGVHLATPEVLPE